MSDRPKKHSRRKNDEKKFDKPKSLTLEDVHCTVCMGIFVEPVTLPCAHTTCKLCFEKTIDNNTLACPLCRKYVGSWIRQRQKNGLMVNEPLWSYIKHHFETHVQKKLRGEDDEVIDGLLEKNIPAPKLCEPGLIRREYEAEKKRMDEEALQRQILEAEASAKLIRELQEREEEEKKHLEELRRKAEEEDALMAQSIAAQMEEEYANKAAAEEQSLRRLLEEEEAQSAFVRLPTHSESSPSSQNLKKGPMDLFLSHLNLGKPARAGSSTSTDSLKSELHHFKPVHHVPTTPPKRSPDGSKGERAEVCKPVPVVQIMEGKALCAVVSPSYSSLRPWLTKDPHVALSDNTNEKKTPGFNLNPIKRKRLPFNIDEKSPKRSKRESPRKVSILEPVLTRIKQRNTSERSFKDSDSGRETDCDEEQDSYDRFGNLSLNETPHSDSTRSSLLLKKQNEPNEHKCDLLSLSVDELSESAEVEQRYRQEQDDYEYALKLQNELNAFAVQNRTYDLRSVVSFSAKTSQMKTVTPKRKVKPKSVTSTSKNGKRRQCTLEESLNFSVKMKL